MGIINRDLDVTQRRVSVHRTIEGGLATGVTAIVGVVENSGLVLGTYASAFGLSNTPTVSFNLYRFNSTGGFTSIPLGSTITVPAFGTSGFITPGFTAVTGSTAGGVTCLQGDLVVALSGGTSAAVATAMLGCVLQRQLDYLKFPGT